MSASWKAQSVEDIRLLAVEICEDTEGCSCTSTEHQNKMHDLAHDARDLINSGVIS